MKINDKTLRKLSFVKMMRKVRIDDSGDTTFLEQELVDKLDFLEENDRIWVKRLLPTPAILNIAIKDRFFLYVNYAMKTLTLNAAT